MVVGLEQGVRVDSVMLGTKVTMEPVNKGFTPRNLQIVRNMINKRFVVEHGTRIECIPHTIQEGFGEE